MQNLRSLFSIFSSDLAIDLGTANTLVYARGKSIVVKAPSTVGVNKNNGQETGLPLLSSPSRSAASCSVRGRC
jgi:hypothetical protein